MLFYIFLVLSGQIRASVGNNKPWIFKGTTPNIQIIFEGRCDEYQELNKNNKEPGLTSYVNCKELWRAFSKAFTHKDPCKTQITEKDYEGFFSMVKQKEKITNKAMFWSGTKEIAHDLSYVNTDYITMEDTLVGYVVNGLTWCGSTKSKDGIDFDQCPQDKKCQSASESFWSSASRNFAESASDKVYLMINSTLQEGFNAYWQRSYFGRIELPTLGKNKRVNNIDVYLVSTIDKTPREKCGEGSLKTLEDDAKKQRINIKCIEDPGMVNALLCAKYPTVKQCKRYSTKRMRKRN